MKRLFKRNLKLLLTGTLMAFLVFILAIPVLASEPYEKIACKEEWEVLKQTNRERLNDGKQAISMPEKMQSACDIRAKEIVGSFSHLRPNEESCFTVLDDKNIFYDLAGENIAAGQTDPKSVMNSWMHSSGHKANILSEYYDHMGVGYCTGGFYRYYWVQLFVGGCQLESIKLNDAGNVKYPAGTSIDDMNRYLIVTCKEHGVSYVPVISQMCSGFKSDQEGTQTIKVKYHDMAVNMNVTIGNSDSVVVKAPAQVKGLSVSKGNKGAAKLSWRKRSGNGYEVWCASSKNGKYKKVKTIKTASTTKCKITSLKSGKRYYFKVRAYKTAGKTKKTGSFSTIKSVVIK